MLKLVSYVIRGKMRKKVLANLSYPITPTQLASNLKTHRSTVSRTLLFLEREGLVKCQTPNEKLGRLYQITALGKKVLDTIKNDLRQ